MRLVLCPFYQINGTVPFILLLFFEAKENFGEKHSVTCHYCVNYFQKGDLLRVTLQVIGIINKYKDLTPIRPPSDPHQDLSYKLGCVPI